MNGLSVRYACHVHTGTPVVVKEYEIVLVNSHLSFKGARVCEEAQAEIEIHFRVSEFAHNNILRVVDVIEGARKWYVVLEYCSEGELFNLGSNSGSLGNH
jgi:serine/threonine protein kinase